jgi:hypothetical protein
MKKEELVKLIEKMEIGDSVDLKSSTFTFGLKCDEIFENPVVVFGGYGTHFSILGLDVHDEEEVADMIIEHIGGYHSNIEGKSHVDLEECSIIK